MQGNSGGGGGAFMLGYMAAQNPGATAAGMVAAAAIFAIVAAGYGAAVMMDTPHREPLVDDIVAHSMQVCENAPTNEGIYTVQLKDGLTSVWSSQLEKYTPANEKTPICSDPGLNNFVLPYNYTQVGTNYRGEYRVMGVHQTHADGTTQVIIVKPKAEERAPNSIDERPDSPLSTGTVLEALHNVPQDVYQHTLPDGSRVSVYLQHDGVTQQEGSSSIKDNDGRGWAGPEQMQEILTHHKFEWPLQSPPITVNGNPFKPANFAPL
jgi:hypothetical protein